ncbi:MAG: preprotein translocase subunit SecG [Flavobacteriales bacterium]
MVAISIIILIICALLALVVLAQNPKGGGLAAGFTGAQQIGGVQRTADFLEKGTWTLAGSLMVLCLISASLQGGTAQEVDAFDTLEESAAPQDVDPSQVDATAGGDTTPAAEQPE